MSAVPLTLLVPDVPTPAAVLVVEALAARVGDRMPDVPVRVTWSREDLLGGVVPLRLCAGRPGADGLGPHPLLTGLLQLRLLAANARPGQAVVLASDADPSPASLAGLRVASRLLERRWGAPVRVAHLRGPGRGLPAVVARLRSEGHATPAVASYLLLPGRTHERLREQARGLGLSSVSDVLGDHPFVAALVVQRHRESSRALSLPQAG